MIIRQATEKDTIHIIRAIQNKHMNYNTPMHIREDIKNGYLFVAEENNKLLGSVAVFYKSHRDYYAITRVCVYSKKSRGKGVASSLIRYSGGLGEENELPLSWGNAKCSKCGSSNVKLLFDLEKKVMIVKCKDCGYEEEIPV